MVGAVVRLLQLLAQDRRRAAHRALDDEVRLDALGDQLERVVAQRVVVAEEEGPRRARERRVAGEELGRAALVRAAAALEREVVDEGEEGRAGDVEREDEGPGGRAAREGLRDAVVRVRGDVEVGLVRLVLEEVDRAAVVTLSC